MPCLRPRFFQQTGKDGTDSFGKKKFVSDNAIVVMSAEGNSTKEQTGKIGGKNVKIKKKKAIHFQIMGTDDAKWEAAKEKGRQTLTFKAMTRNERRNKSRMLLNKSLRKERRSEH